MISNGDSELYGPYAIKLAPITEILMIIMIGLERNYMAKLAEAIWDQKTS